MGMGSIHVSTPERRDRLWLLNAFAIMLLTLLGAAGEALGYDRYLKSNTTKRRTHSLFRQGCMLYDLIPNMPEARSSTRYCTRRSVIGWTNTVAPIYASDPEGDRKVFAAYRAEDCHAAARNCQRCLVFSEVRHSVLSAIDLPLRVGRRGDAGD
jgi:hypothetical protein